MISGARRSANDSRNLGLAKEQRAQQNARPPQGVNETHKLCKEAGGRAGVQAANNVPRAQGKARRELPEHLARRGKLLAILGERGGQL